MRWKSASRTAGSASRARNAARLPSRTSGGNSASPVVLPAVYGYMFSMVGTLAAASASSDSTAPIFA